MLIIAVLVVAFLVLRGGLPGTGADSGATGIPQGQGFGSDLSGSYQQTSGAVGLSILPQGVPPQGGLTGPGYRSARVGAINIRTYAAPPRPFIGTPTVGPALESRSGAGHF